MANSKSDMDILIQRVEKLEQKNTAYKMQLEEYKCNNDIQQALNEIMHISMLPIPLVEVQNRILDIMLNIEWLTLEKKGCMFVVEESGVLTMMAHKNLSTPLLKMCNKVPFGNCLCGKAALEKKLVFKSCLDKEHDYEPAGMTPHGHYNVPIKDRNNTVLGVLNLYVKHGHKPTEQEAIFLNSVCNVLAILFEAKKLEKQLRKRALTDSLTNLKNRRALRDELETYIARAQRNHSKLAVLFLDLNKFKPVNDTHGHDAGDHILKETATRLIKMTRKSDIVARFGGDEFIIVIENIEHLDETVQRLKSLIKEPFQFNGQDVQIGVSIGCALYPDDGRYADALIKIADENMYLDK